MRYELRDVVFRTSSYSGGKDCVAVGGTSGLSLVQDTKDADQNTLVFPTDTFASFIAAVKEDRI